MPSAVGRLFFELKRRRVFRVAGGYLVAGWVVIQVAATVFPAIGAPGWSVALVIGLVAVGFPVALVLAWAFDVTARGVVRTDDIPTAPEGGAASGAAVAGATAPGARVPAASLVPGAGIRTRGRGSPSRRSIAVLPFEAGGADPADVYLGDGIAEEIMSALGRAGGLRVASRLAVRAAQERGTDLASLREALGVGTVLEGSVRRAGSTLRISARLTDTNDGLQLWADTFERDVREIFAMQDEIARAIVRAVSATLGPGQKQPLVRAHTADMEAYNLYLRGRHHWNRRPRETAKALEYLQRALERDPNFALAHAGVADAYNVLGSWEAAALAPFEAFPRAHAAAVRALQLDPNLAEAHTPLAYASMHYLWEWRTAAEQFKAAIALDPRYSHAHHWYSHYLMACGHTEASLTESRTALELDPLDVIMNVHLAWHHWLAREYDATIEQSHRTAELDPHDHWPPFFEGLALAHQGQFGEAVARHRRALDCSGGSVVMLAALGHTYAVAGDVAAARAVVSKLAADAAPRHLSSYEIAVIHAALDERDQAFNWLDRAYADRSAWMAYLNVDPRMDPLRGDPRFGTLVHAVGLTAPVATLVPPTV